MSAQEIYTFYDGRICIAGAPLFEKGIISLPLWKKWARNGGLVLRGGNGRTSLFALDRVPEPHRTKIVQMFGNPTATHPLEPHFKINGRAHTWYSDFGVENATTLKPDQIQQLTINASMLDALLLLKEERLTMRRRSGNGRMEVWPSLISDVVSFNEVLRVKYDGSRHTLPTSDRRLKEALRDYTDSGFGSLIHGGIGNTVAQIVTPEMLKLWMQIYAGQPGMKPNYTEVYEEYSAFLVGTVDIIDHETAEVYDRHAACFRQVSEATVRSYQSAWENRIVGHAIRSGDRQKYRGKYIPFHKLCNPNFAGSMISVDDRQPPFEYASGERMWFYNAIDLGSEAFTCWVYGESKEGILMDFYRQMVRNYAEWGFKLPYELEGEMSLNSAHMNTFLKPGAMFPEVRIEANNARGKRIEAYYRPLRYKLEKKREGWLARPFALAEHNQAGPGPKQLVKKEEIVNGCLRDIETWNNTLHSNQEKFPGLTRWDVFTQYQHPELRPTNWIAVLPHLGYRTQSTMKAGRIILQGMHRVVGFDGKVALGESLIRIMQQIEGEQVNVFWLDDNDGKVLKAMVYDNDGRFVCELLGDLSYSRSKLERTPEEEEYRALTSAYEATVQGYINRHVKEVDRVTIIRNEPAEPARGGFRIKNATRYKAKEQAAEELPPIEDEEPTTQPANNGNRTSTASRF